MTDWGSIPEWVGGVGTIGAIVFAALTYKWDRNKQRDFERREQAELFDVWVEGVSVDVVPFPIDTAPLGTPTMGIRVLASNASTRPIRGVDIRFTTGDWQSDIYLLHTVPPATDATPALRPIIHMPMIQSLDIQRYFSELAAQMDTDVSFTDASGNRWHRDAIGELRFLYNRTERMKENGPSALPGV